MEVLDQLPEGIVTDVMYFMVGGLLAQVPYLAQCDADEGFLATLSTRVVPVVFMAEEVLITQGTRVGEMYFLIRGEAIELWEGHRTKPLRRLVASDFCGDFSIFTDMPSVVSVSALTPCETFMLSQEAFRKVLVYFPTARALFEALKPRKDGSHGSASHAGSHRSGGLSGGRVEVPLALGPQSSGRVTPTGHHSPKLESIQDSRRR